MTAMPRNIVAPTVENLTRAGELIREGRLVAFPTETVYGLGADATNDRAVAEIFAAKERPRFNPLIVHCPDREAAAGVVVWDDRAERLADRFWPGPLTLVLPRRPDCPISLLVSAGLDTVAVRVPAHALALALLAAAERPIAAPSANRAGEVSPTTARHVHESLGERPAMILDGGPCRIGIESTVLDLSRPDAALLRPGGVPHEEVEAVIGPLAKTGSGVEARGEGPRSPGQLTSHYAPRLPLRLNVRAPRPGEALLAFGRPTPSGVTMGTGMNLSPSGDVTEAAANLFAMLRALDRPPHTGIAVMPIPETGLGEAINDRLRRAAGPRRLADGAATR